MSVSALKLGSKYKVEILSNCVPTFDASYDELTLKAILSYEEALKVDDVTSKYQSIKSSGSINVNIRDLIFYKFTTLSGNTIVIADAYMSKATSITTMHLTIEIPSINDTDFSLIKKALDDLGYIDAVYNKNIM